MVDEQLKRNDIKEKIMKFKEQEKGVEKDGNHRYSSFDYCYNYFRTESDLTKDMEKSCLALGFYLASWGMYRGSTFLLWKSAKYFEGVIRYIQELKKESKESLWEKDVDKWNIKELVNIYKKFEKLLTEKDRKPTKTLITKIMLGVFGVVPAYDQYFCKSFSEITERECCFTSFNEKSLELIKNFYDSNKESIDGLEIYTLPFSQGGGRKYI